MTTPLINSTAAVRAGIAADRHHGAVAPPIHLSANFSFREFGAKREFDYTRSGNPTRSYLADALAELEQGHSAVVTSTGMSAITLVLQLVSPGATIVAAHDCYGGTQRLLRALAARGHFDVVFCDLTEPHAAALISARCPRLVWIETPSNPLLRITDISAISSAAHAAGSIVVVDNTFLSPVLQQPITLGADIVVHSTTKYLNGHSDVVGGCVISANSELGEQMKWWGNALGVTGSPFDSYLTLRGLRTLHVRMRQHVENAGAIVDALGNHPAVSRLYYPGRESHAGYDVACRQQYGAGAMVSFELVGGVDSVKRFTEKLQLFTLAESLGGVESLVAHPATMTHASMTEEARQQAGISESLVRLSVGIEHADDLIHDLRQALDSALVRERVSLAVSSHTLTAVPTAFADVVLLGAGNIGRELLAQVSACPSRNTIRICGVVDQSGFVFDSDGIGHADLADIARHKAGGFSLSHHRLGRSATPRESVEQLTTAGLQAPILVDVTASETSTLLETAMSRGFDVVLANKVPLAGTQSAVDNLFLSAALHGRRVLNEATVGAGLPLLDTIRKLVESGDQVQRIEGCPSGTLGFLFGEVEAGVPFSVALRAAVNAGYAEPDPRLDLSGLDVARKALILGRLIGYRGGIESVTVESLVPLHLRDVSVAEFLERSTELDEELSGRIREARTSGEVLRYRARVTPHEIIVGLVAVSARDPLASLTGTDNQFSIVTRRYQQPLVITGPGAGAPVTAAGVFNDVLRLVAERRSVHA